MVRTGQKAALSEHVAGRIVFFQRKKFFFQFGEAGFGRNRCGRMR